jgi:hypothetical protein
MPFNLTPEDESKILSYMTELQFTDSGLSSADVRPCVFHTAEKTGDKTLSIVPVLSSIIVM